MPELKPCPFCGSGVDVYGGQESWKPTLYDPDSGGDPYYISCNCGCDFSIGCFDYKEFVEAWNRRANE